MSQHDLESGSRRGLELAREPGEASFGLICFTRSNLLSPWLLFEARALTKHLDGRACALLLDGLRPTDVAMPFAQFQNRAFSKEEFVALVHDLNRKLELPLDGEQLPLVFEKWWPDPEREYTAVISRKVVNSADAPSRGERDILEEILLRVRDLNPGSGGRQSALRPPTGGDVPERPLGYDSSGWYTLLRFPNLPVSEFWQARAINDVDPNRFSSIRDIDEVVSRARDAVSAYAAEAPGLFKHGTDFITKSLGFVAGDFRRAHSFATETLQAFSKYANLVRPSKEWVRY
jgi:hypothetical protein